MIPVLIALGFIATGCQRKQPLKVEIIEEEAPKLATIVHVADPKATVQLVKGFYELEQNTWRWAAPKFAVTLRPPRGSDRRGAILQLTFTLADAVLSHTKSATIRASTAGVSLEPETFTKAGEYVYSREVPAKLLAGDAVTFEFTVDKWLPASEGDHRDLALIVSTIGLEVK
ncbi:MAG: hypothetical protein HY822_09905 [Acidobacteria bacterium]|nr:hypothetical protein [Acidobacteriota bacterium]